MQSTVCSVCNGRERDREGEREREKEEQGLKQTYMVGSIPLLTSCPTLFCNSS